jgi:hypothetical protein
MMMKYVFMLLIIGLPVLSAQQLDSNRTGNERNVDDDTHRVGMKDRVHMLIKKNEALESEIQDLKVRLLVECQSNDDSRP